MRYDPVKTDLGNVVRAHPLLRRLFYAVLGILFLRSWYVTRELRRLFAHHRLERLLDAGSGFGQYTYYCVKRFPLASVLAVDVKEEQIHDCTEFFRRLGYTHVTFRVEDLLEPLHADEFDLILSVDVMEHIEDDRRVFRNFARALRPGGFLLINTPSDRGGSDTGAAGQEGFIDEHARTGYGADEIAAKLVEAGLAVERITYTYGPWGMRAWRAGIKVPLLLLNRSRAWFLFLPLYYAVVLPFVLAMMALDLSVVNATGAGLLVLARKAR